MNVGDLPGVKRINFVRKLVSTFFLLGIAFSYNLWISDRFFPLLPVVDFLLIQNHFVNVLLVLLLVLLLASNIFIYKRIINLLIIILLVVLLLQDQSRWQPWVYIYFLLLLPFGFIKETTISKFNLVSYFQIVMIGIYAWSGIQKVNSDFITTIFQKILTKFFWFKDTEWITAILPLGYLIPAIEIGIAIFLFSTKFRNLAVFTTIATHLFILLYLSPFGINTNSVVYPWNLAMIGLVLLVFYNVKEPLVIWHSDFRWLNGVAIILVWMMPIFNFWGYWDNYLSFSLYSGKTNAFWVVVGDKELNKIDQKLSQYFLQINGIQGGKIIDLNKWAMAELNVPFYPETKALKMIAKSFCNLGIQEKQLYFLEFELPMEKSKFIRFTCKEINN